MQHNHLAHFYAVARHHSFTRAAAALRIQQPSVTRSVQLLEGELGVTLFERHPRGVELTAAGERIYAAAARLFEEADNIVRIAETERGECRGPLRIAAAGAVASRLIPDALGPLLARHPKVWPMVFSGPTSMAAARIARGDFELGLYFYVDGLVDTLETRALVDVPFHLVVRADRAKHAPTLESFIGSREVEDDRARRFPTLDRLRESHPRAKIRISTNDTEAHLRLVEAGAGVSVLPRFVVAAGLAARTLVDVLPGDSLQFPLILVARKRRVLSAAATALVEAVVGAVTPRRRRPA